MKCSFSRTLAYGTLLFLPGLVAAAVPVANNDMRRVPINTPITIDVLNNDFDADGDAISIISLGEAGNGTVTQLDSGSVQYTPDPGYSGPDAFTYAITDDGVQISAPATVNIVVSNAVLVGNGLLGNDLSVAAALDAACNALLQQLPGELSAGALQLRERCIALQDLAATDPATLASAINQIAPEETMAMIQLGAMSASIQTDAITRRTSSSNTRGNQLIINGFSAGPGNYPGGGAGDADFPFARAGWFLSAQLEDADKDKTAWENGFESRLHALTLGFDYRMDSQLVLGAAAGWTRSDLIYKSGDGSVDTNTATAIVFASQNLENWNNEIQLGYNRNDFEMYRNIRYESSLENFQAHAVSETTGDQIFASAQTRFFWSLQALTLAPQLALNYLDGSIEGYADNNAMGFETVIGDQKLTQLTVELGLQAQYAVNFNWGVLLPQLDVSASSELRSEQDDIRGGFAFSPIDNQTFVMRAEENDKKFYNVAVGTSFVMPNGVSGFLRVDQLLGYENFTSRRIEAGLRLEF